MSYYQTIGTSLFASPGEEPSQVYMLAYCCILSYDCVTFDRFSCYTKLKIALWDFRAPHGPAQIIDAPASLGMITSLHFPGGSTSSDNVYGGDDALLAGFEDGSLCVFDVRSSRCDNMENNECTVGW